ncbi:hypothetical protein ACC760_37895, partial [Rhizobium ruizarguesonis]
VDGLVVCSQDVVIATSQGSDSLSWMERAVCAVATDFSQMPPADKNPSGIGTSRQIVFPRWSTTSMGNTYNLDQL